MRPLINFSIHELEEQFDAKKHDPAFLNILFSELKNRKTKHATDLRNRTVQVLEVLPKSASPVRPKSQEHDEIERPLRETDAPQSVKLPKAVKGLSDKPEQTSAPQRIVFPRAETDLSGMAEPERVMLAWTALEVLSPQSFLKPEDLGGGERSRITRLDNALPWENGGEKSRPNYRLYYQIVLGTIQMEPAITQLLTVYTDKRHERPSKNGESILAAIVVDREGRPPDNDAVAVSSFAWSVPVALKGNLKALGDWPSAERSLLEELDKRIRPQDDEGNLLPLTRDDIQQIYDWLVVQLELPDGMVKPPYFAVKSYQYFKTDEPPEALLLNSFYLSDLDKARSLFKSNAATPNLRRYIGQDKPSQRIDLLRDQDALADALHPSKMPLGRWPANGRHPLVALQQAAVNLSAHTLEHDGILAVNGPPGTGKTTLLRDIVAHVVTERAKIMATYNDPEDGFENTNLRIKRGNAFLWLYKLDERLRGFEIVVASSNNKAVENVSAELPGREAVATDAFTEGYFKTVSDSLLERDTWGLVAAVLGNAANRAKFREKFWWDKDVGLSRYLQHASGTPSMTSVTGEDGKKYDRPPLIVTNERPPSDRIEALNRWRTAREKFLSAEKASQKVLSDAARAAELPQLLQNAEDTISKLEADLGSLSEYMKQLKDELQTAEGEKRSTTEKFEEAQLTLQGVVRTKPALFSRLFHRKTYREWKTQYEGATERFHIATKNQQAATELQEEKERAANSVQQEISVANSKFTRVKEESSALKTELEELQLSLGGTFINRRYFEGSHRERQLASPWLNAATSHARDTVFEAAMELHRAFIDVAAKPLRHNLGLLMDSFGARSFGSPEKDAIIPYLWSSLFLTVPVVSTTFASVGRMFERLEPDTLGWLLIDEAGQALPQAAVGAVMRCKRAVVVGDPLQIEPVVVLPDQLTEAICREFRIDETRFNAPAASAQTLADAATPCFSSFETKAGSREVGVPLLVHRRCADPMFSISNSIAYENLMVQAKAPKQSCVMDVLGPPAWHHIEGEGQDKWCESEGEHVLQMLLRLKRAGIEPNIYIVTPFVIVQDRLRERIRMSGILIDWVQNSNRWPYERIGTVHTVQGREAEAVILVLGAPLARQTGARGWAGGPPNLLNVAVSRAQEVLYVVGNRDLWKKSGVFSELSTRI